MNDRSQQFLDFARTRSGTALTLGSVLSVVGTFGRRQRRGTPLASAAGSALVLVGLSARFTQHDIRTGSIRQDVRALADTVRTQMEGIDRLRSRADSDQQTARAALAAESERLGRTNAAVDTARSEIRKARSEIDRLSSRLAQLEADLRPVAARRAWTSTPAKSTGPKPELFLTEGVSSLGSDPD